jgi:putative transposase
VGNNPTARGQLGTQRRLVTDGQGLPLGIAVDGAHRPDRNRVEAPLEALMSKRPEPTATQPQHLGLDTGCD